MMSAGALPLKQHGMNPAANMQKCTVTIVKVKWPLKLMNQFHYLEPQDRKAGAKTVAEQAKINQRNLPKHHPAKTPETAPSIT